MIHIKSSREIALMKKAGHILANVFEILEPLCKPGVTTNYLSDVAEKVIRQAGGIPEEKGYYGYPAAICASINEEVVHGIPGDRVLREGDIVTVDTVAYKNGYHGDACRTFCIGNVAPEVKQLVKVTEECFFKGIEGLKAGTPLFDIGYRVQKHAESFGYGVIRSYTGHAIGKEMHEDPSVPNFGKLGTGMRLKEGMVLCIEPMIALGSWRVRVLSDRWTAVTEDGKPAAHYENTVVVRKDGVEILTL